MSESIRSLNNIRTLRAQAREVPLETLEEILEKFESVVEERRSEEESYKAELVEREHKRIRLLELIAQEGFQPADLVDLAGNTNKATKITSKRPARPAKYKFYNEAGEECTWTGQGRMPTPIRLGIENEGKTLNDFLI